MVDDASAQQVLDSCRRCAFEKAHPLAHSLFTNGDQLARTVRALQSSQLRARSRRVCSGGRLQTPTGVHTLSKHELELLEVRGGRSIDWYSLSARQDWNNARLANCRSCWQPKAITDRSSASPSRRDPKSLSARRFASRSLHGNTAHCAAVCESSRAGGPSVGCSSSRTFESFGPVIRSCLHDLGLSINMQRLLISVLLEDAIAEARTRVHVSNRQRQRVESSARRQRQQQRVELGNRRAEARRRRRLGQIHSSCGDFSIRRIEAYRNQVKR